MRVQSCISVLPLKEQNWQDKHIKEEFNVSAYMLWSGCDPGCLAMAISHGWRWKSTVVQSRKPDVSAVPFWHWRPGIFLKSGLSPIRVKNLRKAVLMSVKNYYQQQQDRWTGHRECGRGSQIKAAQNLPPSKYSPSQRVPPTLRAGLPTAIKAPLKHPLILSGSIPLVNPDYQRLGH